MSRSLALVLPLLALLAGCPRDVDEPPGAGDPCERIEDCNVSACGALRACVEGFCENRQSVHVPCR